MKISGKLPVWVAIASLASQATAETAMPPTTLARLPVKEITVFKDGHAFVAHEGDLPVDAQGNVLMDYLPTPVVGTFWPYSADKRVRLTGVLASHRRVLVERTALNLRELIEANIGAEVVITEGANRYEATILAVPARTSEELAATSPPNTPERLTQNGNLVLLKTVDGVKPFPIDRIQDITFRQSPKSVIGCEEFRSLLTGRGWSGWTIHRTTLLRHRIEPGPHHNRHVGIEDVAACSGGYGARCEVNR